MLKTSLITAARALQAFLRKQGIDVNKYPDPYVLDTYHKTYSKKLLATKPFYNVGAGGFSHPYWTNIDYVSDWYKGRQVDVLHHDLMSLKPLPIKDNSAKIIYTSHTIEHVSDEAVQSFFNSAYKALESKGVMRVTTGPDAETDFRALMNNDEEWFYWDKMYISKGKYEHIFRKPATQVPLAERWLHHVACQLAPNDICDYPIKMNEKDILEAIEKYGFPEVLDFICSKVEFDPSRPGNHISWWTHEKVMQYLQNAGFKTVYRSGYQQSVSPLLRRTPLFDSTHPQMSIYVEAIKD